MRRILFILTLLSVGLFACGQTGTGWYPERRKVNFRDSTYFTKSANFLVPFRIGGISVTSNAQEMNILDGGLITYTELNNLLNSTGNIQAQLNTKQATLVSGTNIKTVNGNSILGAGNIVIDSTGGSMDYPGVGIPLSDGTQWLTSITNNSIEWDSAYVARLRWSGTSIGLVPSTARTSLGGTTVGQNLFTLTNPSAVTFPRFNADNTVTALSAASLKTALSFTATDVSLGNVTNESKATMFTSPTFTGHPVIEGVTSTGATGTGNLVFSISPTLTGTTTGTFSGNLTGNVTGTASLVTGYTRNSGSLTLSGGHGITLTTTGTTGVILPISGTLVANPMSAVGDLIIGGASGVPSRLAAGITGAEEYSTENYGATGTGDVVLSIGATMTSPTITTPTITGPSITNAPLSTGTITDATGITSAMLSRFMYYSEAAATDISSDPQIANGTTGQIITIIGSSDTNTLTLDDATGLRLSAAMILGIGDSITLFYEGTIGDWIEISRSNN